MHWLICISMVTSRRNLESHIKISHLQKGFSVNLINPQEIRSHGGYHKEKFIIVGY